MNKIQQYEYIRSLSDDQFELVKDIHKHSKCVMWDRIGRVIDVIAAAGLVYVAYDAVDILPAIFAVLGAAQLLISENIKTWAKSITGAIHYSKDVDVAKDAGTQMIKMIADMQNKKLEDMVNSYHEFENEDK